MKFRKPRASKYFADHYCEQCDCFSANKDNQGATGVCEIVEREVYYDDGACKHFVQKEE